MSVLLVLTLLVSAPFLFVLVRRPILRRLALRNTMRRPREALLVVLGSLLGAAIITGSAVVGDTMDSSIRQIARQHLGPVDERVPLTRVPSRDELVDRTEVLTRDLPDRRVHRVADDSRSGDDGRAEQ